MNSTNSDKLEDAILILKKYESSHHATIIVASHNLNKQILNSPVNYTMLLPPSTHTLYAKQPKQSIQKNSQAPLLDQINLQTDFSSTDYKQSNNKQK